MQAQDFKITFNGIGASETIDSVVVENLTRGTSVTIPGNDTLVLIKSVTGSELIKNPSGFIKIYPNPANGFCFVDFICEKQENIIIEVFDLTGKKLVGYSEKSGTGVQHFRINGLKPGINILRVINGKSTVSAKIASNESQVANTEINFLGASLINSEQNKKSAQTTTSNTLIYWQDDNLLYSLWVNGLLPLAPAYRTPVRMDENTINEMDETSEIQDNVNTFTFELTTCKDPAGRSYSTVKIGSNLWMGENYAYQTQSGSWAYNNNEENVPTYGRLYTWKTAMDNAPAGWHLPSIDEWKQHFEYLKSKYNDDSQVAIDAIKSNTLWLLTDDGNSGNGSNSSGMCLLPGGFYSNGNFNGMGLNGNYWTSTISEEDTIYSQIWRLFRWNTGIGTGFMTQEDMGLSVRYVKDKVPTVTTLSASDINGSFASMNGSIENNGGYEITKCGIYWSKTNPNPGANDSIATIECYKGNYSIFIGSLEPGTTYYYRAFATNNNGTGTGSVVSFSTKEENPVYGTFNDYRDGNSYKTIQIGDQIWMAENLRYLPAVSPPSHYSIEVPVYYVFGNTETDVNSAISSDFYRKYGVLYNWAAAMFSCPEGWHIPTSDEWIKLTNFLKDNPELFGTSPSVMSSLSAKTNWSYSPNIGSAGNDLATNNSSGFSALPGGMCQPPNLFSHIETQGYWWSSNQSGFVYDIFTSAGSFNLSYNLGYYQDSYQKVYGFSVRCVKD